MTPERSDHKILIVASDVLLAALVGRLVEARRYLAAFPQPSESPAEAVERIKPLAAVLLDAADQTAQSDLFVSRARRMAVPVFLFGNQAQVEARAGWAHQFGLQVYTLPPDLSRLELAMEALIPDATRPRADRDRRGVAQRRPDGTLTFIDMEGRRWSVYDRRGPDRRFVDRRFVSERGEVRHCGLTEQEASVTTIAVLTAQLERAEHG